MKKIRLVLALLMMSSGIVANAQERGDRQDGVVGSICDASQHHCPPAPDYGGGDPVDPSPYDPVRPGRPDRPHHPGRPNHPHRPDRPDRPDYPNYPNYPDYPNQPNYPDTPNYPDYPNQGGNRREIYIGSRLQNEHLDLMELAGIGYYDRGAVISSVEILAQPGAVQSALSLNVDGFIVASQNYPSSRTILYPNRQLVVGQNFNQMSLGVRGVLYVDRIIVNLRQGGYNPNPNPNPIGDVIASGYIGQTFYQNANVDLIRITNLYQYRGYRVKAVTVRGRTLDSRGSARVVINGIVAGRVDLGYGGDTVTMPISAIVGQNLNSLNLQIVPTSQIDRIDVVLSRY